MHSAFPMIRHFIIDLIKSHIVAIMVCPTDEVRWLRAPGLSYSLGTVCSLSTALCLGLHNVDIEIYPDDLLKAPGYINQHL